MELKDLKGLNKTVNLGDLSRKQVKDLQRALSYLCYPVGPIDGLIGVKTITAWANFKEDNYQGRYDLIGMGSIEVLEQKLKPIIVNFDSIANTIDSIIKSAERFGFNKYQYCYILATVEHETAHTFEPVIEAFWKDEAWRKANLRYYPYYGRGFVQLTWKNNYKKYSEILGIDLVKNPDLAKNPDIALFILLHGFKTGSFTGVKLDDFVKDSNNYDYINARKCINWTDKAKEIAEIANKYLKKYA